MRSSLLAVVQFLIGGLVGKCALVASFLLLAGAESQALFAACEQKCKECNFFGKYDETLCYGAYLIDDMTMDEVSVKFCHLGAWVNGGDENLECNSIAGEGVYIWEWNTCTHTCTDPLAGWEEKNAGTEYDREPKVDLSKCTVPE
ncbi:MAG: hypothetical protein WD872_19965 [Pirellulaceae bacterium]